MFFTILVVSMGSFIGLCIYIDAFSKDFEYLINNLNTQILLNCKEKSTLDRRNNEIRSIIKEAIWLHINMLKYLQFFH